MIGLADAENVTHFRGLEPLDVPQFHHRALRGRHGLESPLDDRSDLLREQQPFRRERPFSRPIAPVPRLVETVRDGRVLVCGIEKDVPPFLRGAAPRAVREDPVEPGPKPGAPLEPLDTAKDADPGVLDDVFGQMVISHVGTS